MILERDIKSASLLDSIRGTKYDELPENVRKKLMKLDDPINERHELENYAWYKGDADSLLYYYQYTLRMFLPETDFDVKIRRTYRDFFWYANTDDVKKTHSGLAREICETVANCVGVPTKIKVEGEPGKTEIIRQINDANGFKEFEHTQISETIGLGNSGIFVDIVPGQTYPVYRLVSGLYCAFEWRGNTVVSMSKRQFIQKKNILYELLETRGTKKKKLEGDETERTVATVDYDLFKVAGDRLVQVPLTELPETAGLEHIEFNNVPFMLAVPCVWNKPSDSDRGRSIFQEKIPLLDDFDQNLSQESNVMRTQTPTEVWDTRSLPMSKDGNYTFPSGFGKKYAFYRSSENASEEVKPPTVSYNEANFQNLSTESLETLMRCLSGIISPATLGYDVARNSTDLAQREKEKVTIKTCDKVIDLEEKILSKLFNIALAMYQLMQDRNADIKEEKFTIIFPGYANSSFESKITAILPLLQSGAISPERFVDELWGDSLNDEDKKKEVEYIKNQTKTQEVKDFGDDVYE